MHGLFVLGKGAGEGAGGENVGRRRRHDMEDAFLWYGIFLSGEPERSIRGCGVGVSFSQSVDYYVCHGVFECDSQT